MKGFAERIGTVQEYYFSKKLREVKAMEAAGMPIIHMGIGSPDLAPHPSVVQALQTTAQQPESHGYQSYEGTPALRMAFAAYYNETYGLTTIQESEVLPLMGSKEGIMHISQAFVNPGDEVLIPDPGYPTYASVTKLSGGVPRYYELNEANGWYPNIQNLEDSDLSKVKLMWLNYPHMPSGAAANLQVFEQLVAFAQRHNILLVHDNPYSTILEENPKSIFQVAGAKEVALELNSLSKSANLAGWRVGCVVGQKTWLDAILRVKSNMDSGMFLGIQNGAIAALGLPASWYRDQNDIYRSRRGLMLTLAGKLGLEANISSVGMFVWAKITNGQSSEDFVDQLLQKHHLFITPGNIFGKEGEGYVRLSLCTPENKIEEAITRLEKS